MARPLEAEREPRSRSVIAMNKIVVMANPQTLRQLSSLANGINTAVQAAEASARSAIDNAMEAGRLLNEAKALMQHGMWESWLRDHCTVAPRTARAYMRLASQVPLLPNAERRRVADLPLRDAIKAISTAPTAPPRARDTDHRVASNDEAERTASDLSKCATKLREAARHIKLIHTLKGKEIARLRERLTQTLQLLDSLEAA